MKDLNNNPITREAQLQNREVLWGSSVDQTDEPMNKNVIGGANGGRAGQGSRSPSGQTRCVNDAVVSGQCINLSGEASNGSLTGFESTHSKSSVSASNGGDNTDRGVSRWHNSRGNEHGVAAEGSPVQRRVMKDSRSGEGLKPYSNGTPSRNELINADRRGSERVYWIQTVNTSIFRWVEATALKQTA